MAKHRPHALLDFESCDHFDLRVRYRGKPPNAPEKDFRLSNPAWEKIIAKLRPPRSGRPSDTYRRAIEGEIALYVEQAPNGEPPEWVDRDRLLAVATRIAMAADALRAAAAECDERDETWIIAARMATRLRLRPGFLFAPGEDFVKLTEHLANAAAFYREWVERDSTLRPRSRRKGLKSTGPREDVHFTALVCGLGQIVQAWTGEGPELSRRGVKADRFGPTRKSGWGGSFGDVLTIIRGEVPGLRRMRSRSSGGRSKHTARVLTRTGFLDRVKEVLRLHPQLPETRR